MAKPIILTDDGLKKLESELEYLKTTARKEIAEKIKTARGFGDLSENSEYDEAKNEQAKIEARIIELDALLKNVEIISDDEINSGHVVIGSKVKILDVEFNEELEYKIVGSAEADPSNGSISDESPVGKALLGHAIGDEVIAEAPGGHLTFKILDIIK
ncbi:MAG: transcription elongation factor GreA [Clostridia bacterium]|nr:transcription elongation factor GreA [Clostridia bacterium]